MIPYVLLIPEPIYIINDCDLDCDSDHFMIQCDNISLSSLTSFTVSFAPSSLETMTLSSDHDLGHSAFCSVTNSRLSSLLSSTCSSVSVLDPSSVSSWLSSDAYVLDTIEPFSNPSNASNFVH